MDEGFPQHTIGFMRRKREKEQQNDRGKNPHSPERNADARSPAHCHAVH